MSQLKSQIAPSGDEPRHDLDLSASLGKHLEDGKLGSTNADISWEPKITLNALPDNYSSHYGGPRVERHLSLVQCTPIVNGAKCTDVYMVGCGTKLGRPHLA